MSADSSLAREVARRQVAMFAMFVGPGLFTTRAALAEASDIPASTLKDWAGGTAMPFHAVLALSKFLPGAAINMMAEPGGKRIVDADETASDWDALAAASSGLTAEICEARVDGIDHCEEARLRKRTRDLIARAQSVVGEDR